MSIFVGNLPFRAEQEDVVELFSPHGEVVNCSLPLERDTGRKRGFAFVEMADPEMESRAVEALQGAELMGRPLRINKAEPRGSAPRRAGGGGGYGGGGGGGYGGGGGGGAAPGAADGSRGSGARGWEDRSYGGGSPESGFEAGRTRRRRSGSAGAGGGSGGGFDGGFQDGDGGYPGAQD
ncbi:MAG: RNA recognition motif domain-containing protein [Prochlorococcaceae cyanobacterium]